MDLEDALKVIKSGLKKELVQSRHFIEQIEERNLEFSEIIEVIRKQQIMGILEQDENLYKLWFKFGESKDLNIIVKILDIKKLRLITVFPCYSERRKR